MNRANSLEDAVSRLTAQIPAAAGQNPAAAPAFPAHRRLSVTLHYIATSPIRVWGPVTGKAYDFSAARSVQAVDPRDASGLTRSDLFHRL